MQNSEFSRYAPCLTKIWYFEPKDVPNEPIWNFLNPLDTIIYSIECSPCEIADSVYIDVGEQCIIDGFSQLIINEFANYSVSELLDTSICCANAFWSIINNENDGTQASIISDPENDLSVEISAGSIRGRFVLYYNIKTCDSCYQIACTKPVFVNNPLPVELTLFLSNVLNHSVNLIWTTSIESNNSGFEIQHSAADKIWTSIGFVNGAGNSAEPNRYTFTDRNLNSGVYNYRLKQIDFNGNFKYYDLSNEVVIGVPDKFSLHQNYPNPFNPVTKIRYDLPNSGKVSLKIYDNIGREVITLISEFKDAGYYTVEFDGSNFASGIYYYKLETGNFVATKKMVLLK